MAEPKKAQALRFRHALQREIGRIAGPLWIPLAAALLRFGMRYRVENVQSLRREYQALRAGSDTPLLICANHLTLIDSIIITWALVSPWRLVFRFNSMPWNTPERANFAAKWWQRIGSYLAKCIPVTRGGRREEIAEVLQRVNYLLRRGEVAVIFPEGGRSRSGRVDIENYAWGTGRIAASVPGCHVLCVYLRGRKQEAWGETPIRGERFHMELACIQPKTDFRGPRAVRDISVQIITQLACMEERYFDARQ